MRTQQTGQVGRQVRRSLLATRGDQLAETTDPGAHQQRRDAEPHRPLDVGVEPVPHHQRTLTTHPPDRLLEQRALRLPRHDRVDAGEPAQRLDQHPVAGGGAVGGRDRHVGVGGDPSQSVADADRRPHHVAPQHVGAVAGHHRVGVVLHPDRGQSFGEQGLLEAVRSEEHHPGTGFEPGTEHPGGGLRRRHDVRGVSPDAESGEVVGDRVRGSGGVVGDERRPHSPVPRCSDRLGCPGHRSAAHVDHAVEVEHHQVVDLAQLPITPAQHVVQPTME